MAVAGGGTFTLAASAARTTGASGTAVVVGGWRRAVVQLSVTASATDAADKLDVYVDVLAPDAVTWLNAIHFTQKDGNTAAIKEFAVLDSSNPGAVSINVTSDAASGVVRPALFGSQMRARWAIVDGGGAGDQSHTFAVTAYLV
jgi:hypothetical protein